MENDSPLAQPNNGQAIFAALRDILADLYSEQNDARVVVDDAELDARQIAFSPRAQTNWHNILAEAIRQARLDPLLKIVLADYTANPTLLTAYGQYRLFIDQGGYLEAPVPLPADTGVTIGGDVNLNQGDFVGRDKLIAGDDVGGNKIEGDEIDARASQGFLNRPAVPVIQHFGTAINIGALKIPIYLVVIISLCLIGIFGVVAYPSIAQWLPTPRAFDAQANGETLIVIATFHNTAATDSEAHIKIRRAIADAAASHNEQQIRVEVEPTELTADQRTEAEALGNRYNASMVIWGEDTGVEVIVNFLNLKEPDFDAVAATITERERTQLANPSAYARFITQDLPQTMNFFAFFAVGQSYFLNTQYPLAIERIEASVAFVPSETKPAGLAEAYFRLGWLYQVPTPADLNQAIASYDQVIHLNPALAGAYNNRGNALVDQGKLEEALADFDQAIHLNSDDATAYNNGGIAYAAQGKLEEAIADFDQAIQLDPNNAAVYYNRGLTLSDQGKLDAALANFDQAIHLNPNYEAYNNRGNAYAAQGKLDVALTDFDQAIHLNPDDANAFGARGLAYRNLSKPKEALADFRRYLELQPNTKNRALVEGWIAEAEAELAKLK